MLFWRLSGRRHARAFDGGYGLLFDGRWNTRGHRVTYCATSPSLCVLEKLVHIEDFALMPDLVMITYDMPEAMAAETVSLDGLPADWRRREELTQELGDTWQGAGKTAILMMPSAIVPFRDAPDRNAMINHAHPAANEIKIVAAEDFALDARLSRGF